MKEIVTSTNGYFHTIKKKQQKHFCLTYVN